MYKYQLWGAEVTSDVPLNINDADLKRKLVELKMCVDRHNVVTGKFVIKDNKAYAYVDESLIKHWKKEFATQGLVAPICYVGNLKDDVSKFNPTPVYKLGE